MSSVKSSKMRGFPRAEAVAKTNTLKPSSNRPLRHVGGFEAGALRKLRNQSNGASNTRGIRPTSARVAARTTPYKQR